MNDRLLLNVTPNFPYPRSPFSGIFVARQLACLRTIGWDSITIHPQALLSKQRLGTPRREETEAGAVYRPSYLWGGWRLPRLLPFPESWAFERAVRRCVRSILHHARPDVLVCNWLYPGGPGCLRLARELGIPVLMVARGSDVRLLGTMDPVPRRELVGVFAQADALVTNGRGLHDDLHRIAPELAARAVVMDFGVDTELFHPPSPAQRAASRQRLGLDPGRRTLLFAGRWEIAKGSRDVLDVLSRVLPDQPRWDFVVAGPVLDRESASQLSERFGARFLGLVSQEELREAYGAADALILLSHQEGQPNVVKEAMSSGVAPIAYRVGGVPDIVEDGVNGLSVAPLQIDEATEALRRLMGDDGLRERLGREARKKIERSHRLSSRMEMFADLLASLVDRGRRASA